MHETQHLKTVGMQSFDRINWQFTTHPDLDLAHPETEFTIGRVAQLAEQLTLNQ